MKPQPVQVNKKISLSAPLLNEHNEELLQNLSPEMAEHFLLQTNLLLEQTEEILLLTEEFLKILN